MNTSYSSADTSEIWQQVIAIVKENLSDICFRTWFSNVKLDSILPDCVVLTTSPEFNRSILEVRYQECIKKAFYAVTSRQYSIEIKTATGKPAYDRSAPEVFAVKDSGLLPEYTFDNLIIGDCNRLAVKAAERVTKGHMKFNPLYIYGRVGTGKTHLLHAIGNYITAHGNSTVVLYIGMVEFINDMITCIKEDRFLDFDLKYSGVDVLLIDDLQHIEGKDRSQAELCRVINSLIKKGSQVVLAANKSPECLSYLNESFSSQFELGASISLEEPDIYVKREILKAHARTKEITLSDDEVINLANIHYRGVRELKNSINRISALQEL